tara:strand:- start:60 stop:539 length:480 start_codon:yes stop_codon:yes gene_type:complete
MSNKPLSVAISAVIKDNNILLIKRNRGDYPNFWALPGGKIEQNEHVSDAAVREILEESGLQTQFRNHLGFVSEHLVENNEIQKHFLLHICELEPQTMAFQQQEEGELRWFNLDNIKHHKDKIIPSDSLMIEKIIKNRESNYFNCVIEKVNDKHILRKFD